jgi:hypothetical protein
VCFVNTENADRRAYHLADSSPLPENALVWPSSRRETSIMPTRVALPLNLFLLWASAPLADESTADLLREVRTAATQGTAARASWDKIVARGPVVLPELLAAMDTPDTVTANWLRTAFDRIVDAERQKGGKALNAEALLKVLQDTRRSGRVRRLALEVVEELRPGTSARLTPGWLEDPEFRYEAVAALLEKTAALAKGGTKEEAVAVYHQAFVACRDVTQAQTLAGRLKALGVTISVAAHLGFLTDWYVIGPFDAHGRKGFTTVYPPEEKIDLTAELPGKSGPVRWRRYRVKEAAAGTPARAALVNLLEPLGNAEDAVAYAYTAFRVDRPGVVEFRGAADDNFTVWVNGDRRFGFEEYRNGVRLDRHRFSVNLRAGVNTVLVKVCQAPAEPNNTEPNWEFLLRVVDPTGKGIQLNSALPAEPGK